MTQRKRQLKTEPTLAPGINDEQILEQRATKNEVKIGEYTSVTTLSDDELDPS